MSNPVPTTNDDEKKTSRTTQTLTTEQDNAHIQLQNDNNNDDENQYTEFFMSEVARFYQPNLQSTQQHHHSTTAVENHSATAPDPVTSNTNITDASASSKEINDDTNNHNVNTQNTTNNNTDTSKLMFLEQDTQVISPYQCLVRKQIEVFEYSQTHSEHHGITKGRIRPIVPGQVGIRCRHCGTDKVHSKARYAILFPSRLIGVYQVAQNMANTHLLQTCKVIPKDIREELVQVRSRDKDKKTRKSAYGGGRQYWADCLRELDVIESDDGRLRFKANSSSSSV